MNLGLIGRRLSHSFSQSYFNSLFKELELEAYTYENIELEQNELSSFMEQNELDGFNVTVPYKQEIMQFLDVIDDSAREIGAVNTVVRYQNGWIGFNTDVIGFEISLLDFYDLNVGKLCLVLGSGGAAHAATYVLNKIGKKYDIVSRSQGRGTLIYQELHGRIKEYDLIVNTTPLGMFPDILQAPDIPYNEIDQNFYAYDMIYNPKKTLFLRNCSKHKAHIKNGEDMLKLQAQAAWVIWNRFYE